MRGVTRAGVPPRARDARRFASSRVEKCAEARDGATGRRAPPQKFFRSRFAATTATGGIGRARCAPH
eukprot:26893-Pelagococcus_subviridis.AAC.5